MSQTNTPKQGFGGISIKEISLPKGGGAIRGLGDSFQPDLFSGMGSLSIPINVTSARGLEPSLSLQYNSGFGSSAFGLGFSLPISSVSINTDKGIPNYQGKDVYKLSGSGELVKKEPANNSVGDSKHVSDTTDEITLYLPRVENSFAKIEQITNPVTGISYWKVISKENITSIYGKSPEACIFNPDDPVQVFEWLIEETYDAKGNRILYNYKKENEENVPDKIYNKNRNVTANRYIHSVQYGNYFDETGQEQFAFEVIFDYGEYDISNPLKAHQPVGDWLCRPDPFSSYRSGFEIRTYRLCRNVLMFHHFKELKTPMLVRVTSLQYSSLQSYANLDFQNLSLLNKVVVTGYRKEDDNTFFGQSMPAIDFAYSRFEPPAAPKFQTLRMGEVDIPLPIDQTQLVPVDLYGEGLPGFLYSNQQTTVYLEPQGEGKYTLPIACESFPVNKNIQAGWAELNDIDGNGQLELVVNNTAQVGFYQQHNEGGWENFQSFPDYPTNISLPEMETVDLNGNGKLDLLLPGTEQLLIYFSKGKEGFDKGVLVLNENGIPLVKPSYTKEMVVFADMFGDGLSHRVRIRSGSVECWPNLGYGRFGKKVLLGNAPTYQGQLNTKKLFLADITGSGAVSIIYVYPEYAEIFLNQNGNSFSDPIRIMLPDLFTSLDQISFSDVLGNGNTCMVFSKMSTTPVHYFYNFIGDITDDKLAVSPAIKPNLLVEINNNLGALTKIKYCSSTRFALEDKKAGRPWATRLRVPIQVVEEVTTIDQLSEARYVSRFKYHDGYYDNHERSFKGFGFIETWDAQSFEQYQLTLPPEKFPVNRVNKELFVPPVYAKTWFHTGAFTESPIISQQYNKEYYSGDKDAYDFPDSVFDQGIYSNAVMLRQAYASLSGHILRKEVYSDDGTILATVPYSVDQNNYKVYLLQPGDESRHSVLLVAARENISYHYERDASDPRVQQQFTLEVDMLCGEAKKTCTIYLPRRANINKVIYPEQVSIKSTAQWDTYINTPDELAYRWRGLLCESQELEIYNLDLQNQFYFSYEEIKQQTDEAFQNVIPYGGNLVKNQLQVMQLGWNKAFFWDEAQTNCLKLTEISARGLLHHEESAVFTNEWINAAYAGKLDEKSIREQGGYGYDSDSKYWWNKGLVQYYFPPEKPGSFFLPCKTENSFTDKKSSLFKRTEIEYEPWYCMLPISIQYFLDDTLSNSEHALVDLQTRNYMQRVDINNNVGQVLFDPLGMVVATSLFGKENGVSKGGMRLYAYGGQPEQYSRRLKTKNGDEISFQDVLDNREYYLQGAASYFFYNLFALKEKLNVLQPSSSVTLSADNYYQEGNILSLFSCQVSVEYADGLNRVIEKKILTSPGPAFLRSGDGQLMRDESNKVMSVVVAERWIVSGRTVYNNKNKPCQQYLPYFSNTPLYESQDEIVAEGLVPPPTVIHYDPLLRIIRSDTAKGFFTKVDFTPWEQRYYDEDDTVLESDFYKDNYPGNVSPEEKKALDKAAAFFNTPRIKIFDNTGNIFRDVQTSNETYSCGKQLTTYYKNDIQARIIESTDPRLFCFNQQQGTQLYNFKYRYSMGNSAPIYIDSIDAGLQISFRNIFDVDVLLWTPRNFLQRMSYDRLQRKKTCEVQDMNPGQSSISLVEVYKYGEEVNNATDCNLIGEVYEVKDLSGITTFKQYSLLGEALQVSKQLAKDYKTDINWNNAVALESEIYETKSAFNALNLLISETSPDNTTTNRSYNQSGGLITVTAVYNDGKTDSIIDQIEYDQNQQRTMVRYGNGIQTTYSYEDTTQRLLTLYSKRPGAKLRRQKQDNTTVQDITYTYDPVGNLTSIYDNTYKTVFNNNEVVEPTMYYTYDAFYRVTESSGRQHPGIAINTYKNNRPESFKQSIFSQLPGANDDEQLQNYKEIYTYDDAGNLIKTQHIVKDKIGLAGGSWTRENPVLPTSNWLKDYNYDASGNLLQLEINSPLVNLTYNYLENLTEAAVIVRPNELNDADYYVYDSGEERARKVSERWIEGAAVSLIQEKIYLGNFEITRHRSINATGTDTVTLLRNTLRIMDEDSCVAIMNYWVKDDTKKQVDKAGTRQLRFQLNNNLGSVSLEMDVDAKLISYEEYFPYGGTAIIAGDNQKEVELKDYRYSGKECDDSTGLYYYGARYYCTWLGRWLNADPSGAVDGLNIYAYVGGNPIVFTDDDGKGKVKKTKSKLPSHTTLNAGFKTVGRSVRKKLNITKKFAALIANPVGHKSDFLHKVLAKPILLQNEKWGVFYRQIMDEQDELISTSSVRELVKGVLSASNKSLDASEEKVFNDALNFMSRVRFPTKWSGFARSASMHGADRMQHPTAVGLGIWRAILVKGDGNPHSELDTRRKQAVLETMVAEVNKGSDLETVLKAGVVRAITFTLNEFSAPATANDQHVLPTVTPSERVAQGKGREALKKIALDLGAVQQASLDETPTRAWGDRRGRGDLSPRRKYP